MMIDVNPYNPLRPVEKPEHFFGREDAFAFFRQNLVGASHRRALVLIGRRGLGKSSVAHQLSYHLEERYRPCIVSLGAVELDGEDTLIAELVDAIRLTLEEAEASTLRLPDWPEPGSELEEADAPSLRDWFNMTYVDIALAALRQRHLLLVLDDAHLLVEALENGALPGDCLDYLGAVLATHERLDLIFTLDAAFEDRALDITLLNEPTLHFRLTELDRDDAERLVREPGADTLAYEDGIVEEILALAGGHPFLLHSICRLLFRRSEESRHAGPVDDEDLAAVRDAALDQASEIFDPLWRGATPNEQLALTTLVKLREVLPDERIAFGAIHTWMTSSGYALNKTQLAAALRGLDYAGLIGTDADGLFFFPATLIPAWVGAGTTVQEERLLLTRFDRAHLVPIVGLVAVLLMVAGLGLAALSGAFDSDRTSKGDDAGGQTNTPSQNLVETRQADEATQRSWEATQTERARPTITPEPTPTLEPTVTPEPTDTPEPTPSPEPTDTPRPTRTPRPSVTPTDIPPTATSDMPPTNTPRPTAVPTLDPG